MTDGFGAIGLLFLAVPLIIIAVAVFAAGRGVARVTRSQKLKEIGRETTGTIVDNQMESRTNSSGNGMRRSYMVFRPVVRYRTQEGQEVTAIGPAESRRSFVAGTSVPLRYHPEHPDQVEITSGPGSGSGGLGMIIGGLVMTVFAIFFLTFACQMQKATACSPFESPFDSEPGISVDC